MTDSKPTEPLRCDACGKTIAQHGLLLQCYPTAAKHELRSDVREMQIAFGDLCGAYTEAAAAYIANRHLRLAELIEASPGLEAKREVLKASDAEFVSKLGAAGERLQRELNALFATLAVAPEAQASPRSTSRRDKIAEQFSDLSDSAIAGGMGSYTNTPY